MEIVKKRRFHGFLIRHVGNRTWLCAKYETKEISTGTLFEGWTYMFDVKVREIKDEEWQIGGTKLKEMTKKIITTKLGKIVWGISI